MDVVRPDVVIPPAEGGMEGGTDPCSALADCGSCTAMAGCGFCAGTGRCLSGAAAGSTDGTCTGAGWGFGAGACMMPPADAGAEAGPTDASTMCPAGLLNCAGTCVDTQADTANCGACGRVCAAGETCSAGACSVPCAAGQMRCGGACVDTTSSATNCGACGRTCAARERCSMSTCVPDCPVGQTACGGVCIDTLTDTNNCGLCGNVCGATETCAGGMCRPRCPAGQTSCGAACVDTQTDRTNCGMCGRACAAGENCSMGVCAAACAAPTMLCGATCIDTTTSAANCGACGRACAPAANSTPTCAMSTCGLTCNAGFGNCDMNAANGCETNTNTSVTNCGACGRACTAGPNQTAACTTGACRLTCNTGFGDCDGNAANGCETNLNTTANNCGRCGTTCPAPVGGTATCAAAVCGGTCAAGATICGAAPGNPGRCVDLQSDATNCGMCGQACPGGQSCVMGTCRMLCPAGQTACGATMTCVNLNTSTLNCGACGRTCAAGQGCVNGTCLQPFRITSMGAAACTVVNNDPVNGDQRGNLAVGASRLLVGADNGTGGFDPANVASAPSMVPTVLDGVVYDAFSGAMFLLGDATGPIRAFTGARTIDRLWRTQNGSWVVTAPVMLSRTIPLDTSSASTSTGIYSGGGRAIIHTTNVFDINLTNGVVTDRGAMPQPPRAGAETFHTSGIVESTGAAVFLTYVQSSTTIARVSVPGGVVSTVGSFANLGDAGHLAVYSNGPNSRWLTRVEGTSQFGAIAEALVSCPVTVTQNTTTGQFIVSGYSVAGCAAIDTNGTAGDDRGPIAISSGQAYVVGDAGTIRVFSAQTPVLANSAAVGTLGDHLVYNLRNGTVFGLFAGNLPLQGNMGNVVVNRIVPLNEFNLQPSGAAITLSQTITVNTSAGASANMMFHGWDRTVIVTGGRAWNINLTNGDVGDFGALIVPGHQNGEAWAAIGVAETAGTSTDLVFVESTTRVARLRLGAATLGTVGMFTNLGDMGTIGFSPARMRWYWQAEGTNQFTPATFAEYVGSCPATFVN